MFYYVQGSCPVPLCISVDFYFMEVVGCLPSSTDSSIVYRHFCSDLLGGGVYSHVHFTDEKTKVQSHKAGGSWRREWSSSWSDLKMLPLLSQDTAEREIVPWWRVFLFRDEKSLWRARFFMNSAYFNFRPGAFRSARHHSRLTLPRHLRESCLQLCPTDLHVNGFTIGVAGEFSSGLAGRVETAKAAGWVRDGSWRSLLRWPGSFAPLGGWLSWSSRLLSFQIYLTSSWTVAWMEMLANTSRRRFLGGLERDLPFPWIYT